MSVFSSVQLAPTDRPGKSAATSSITIIVPARDEEQHLAGAVATIVDAAERWFDEYEILVFNDASTDRTGEVAENLAARYGAVQAIHNQRPQNMGGVIDMGFQRAAMAYVMYVDGKGATSGEALDAIFSHLGQSDMVIPYATNMHERRISRRFISWSFRSLLNTLFRLDLKHYTNSVLFRTALARRFSIHTKSYAYQAETVIKLIKSGCSYQQVGYKDRFDIEGRTSKAFKIKNVVGVGTFLVRTLWEVYVTRRF